MAFKRDGFYYNQQMKSYALQFMAIFSGLQVQIGKWNSEDEKLISVPIHYGHPDRVVSSIISDNTQNAPLRLPCMSAYIRNLRWDPTRVHGTGIEHRTSYVPLGGITPDDIKVVHRRMPVPYTIEMELGILASNTDQHFQMLEQILPLFEPQLQIQLTDSLYDHTRISSVLLTNMQIDSAYPVGTKNRVVQSTLNFDVQGWIAIPAEVKHDFIERIYTRLGVVSTSAQTGEEMLADLDAGGFTYELDSDAAEVSM